MVQLKGHAKQRYVSDMFSSISKHYDLMNNLMTMGMHRRWKLQTANQTATGLSGFGLDVASGTGDLALALGKISNLNAVVGVDLIPEMVALARHKIRQWRQCERTSMVLGDALSLPFPDDTFSCATAGFSLRNMPDLSGALREMVRVVNPGGRITTLELTPLQHGLKRYLFRPYFHRLVPLIGGLVAGNRSAYSYLPQSVDVFPDVDLLSCIMEESGMVDVGYQLVGFGTVAIHQGTKPYF